MIIPGPILSQGRREETQPNVCSKRRDSESWTDIDRQNQHCAMKSEGGALVTGSDQPSCHNVHETTGDRWRAPAKRLRLNTFGRSGVENNRQKFSIPLRWQKIGLFIRFGTRALDAAGNFSPPRPRIHLISSRPSIYIHRPCPTRSGLAVGCSHVEIEGLSSRELFVISVLTIFNVKAQVPPRTAA